MVENIDCTIVAQQPKLRPYIEKMIANVAGTLGIEEGRVNIKATTEEGLGFTGREEGIAAQAVCLLRSALEDLDRPSGCPGCPGCQAEQP